ncbi:hypothetical protein QR685DRAFT_533850 [Neurospora intermedia]|uniref:Uncharacterized protein n=1 Tax=Neurospora intermedia TaxID=5142 RepID=A0ABR3D3H8_NEUIN
MTTHSGFEITSGFPVYFFLQFAFDITIEDVQAGLSQGAVRIALLQELLALGGEDCMMMMMMMMMTMFLALKSVQ